MDRIRLEACPTPTLLVSKMICDCLQMFLENIFVVHMTLGEGRVEATMVEVAPLCSQYLCIRTNTYIYRERSSSYFSHLYGTLGMCVL